MATVTQLRPREAPAAPAPLSPRRDLIPPVAAFFLSLGLEPADMFLVDHVIPAALVADLYAAMAVLLASRP